MADQKNLEDQLNILFDDFEDDAEEVVSAAVSEVKTAAAEVKTAAASVSESAAPVKAAAAKTAAEVKTAVDDDRMENEFRGINFEDFDSLMSDDDDEAPAVYEEKPSRMTAEKAVSDALDFGVEELEEVEPAKPAKAAKTVKKAAAPKPSDFDEVDLDTDEEDYEEDEESSEDEDEEEAEAPVRRKPAKKQEERRSSRYEQTSEQMKKESIRFWIFTAIVALLVAAAVLFILNRRGIIDFGAKETTTTTVETTTTAAETTTTVAETTTTAAETTAEETTEEDTTADTAAETTNAAGDVASVVSNYSNMFMVAEGTPTLNLRDAASSEGAVIGIINEFGGGEILEQSGDWYRVRSGGIEGYVAAAYVVTGDEAKALAPAHAVLAVRTSSENDINVRTAASTDSEILDTAKAGSVFAYLGEESGFYHIQYNATYDGYVSCDFSSLGYYLNEAAPYTAE